MSFNANVWFLESQTDPGCNKYTGNKREQLISKAQVGVQANHTTYDHTGQHQSTAITVESLGAPSDFSHPSPDRKDLFSKDHDRSVSLC